MLFVVKSNELVYFFGCLLVGGYYDSPSNRLIG